MKFGKLGINPKAWEGKTFAEFNKYCEGKLISTERKAAWEEIQSVLPKKPKKVEEKPKEVKPEK